MASFTLTREIAAPAEVVFDVLTDHAGYAKLTPLRRSQLERAGSPDPNGMGAIRKLTAVGPPMREEVIAFQRPSRFSYTVLSGLPVRDHVGTVEPSEDGGRTKMVYAIRTHPTIPLAGFVVVAAVKQAVKGLIDGVAKESERRAAAAG